MSKIGVAVAFGFQNNALMAIGVKTQGRTGNYMFQFAFAYAASKQLKTAFFLDDLKGLEWFELYKKYYFRNLFTLFYIKWGYKFHYLIHLFTGGENSSQKYLGLNIKNITQSENFKSNLSLNDNTFYNNGFFQSFNYFKCSEKELRKLFVIKKQYQEQFVSLDKSHLKEKYIAVHIRRTDYINWEIKEIGEKNYTLPLEYYYNCFKEIKDLDEYKIIFLSDDIAFAKNNFGHMPNCIFENNSAVIDFQILQYAELLIVSNSSFAWWAAFLSKKAKRVFAPEFWLGFKVKKEFPCDVIHADWKKISVFE